VTELPQPIFIVGQYKCGTSWLQRSLAAHPDMVGVSEFDVVKATCALSPSGARLRTPDQRLAEYFDRSGWCARWDGEKWLLRDTVARLRSGNAHVQVAGDDSELQKFDNLTPEAADRLYRRVRDASHAFEAMDAWLEAVSEPWPDKRYIVLKAADQVAGFRVLQAWRPDAPKLFITRDGRDASISEEHYRSLMSERDAPWYRHRPDRDYERRLHVWAARVALAAEHAGRGDLTVLRYEDLSADFAGSIEPILRRLGVAADPDTVATIQQRTSFSRMAKRERGEEARSTMRKGATGEFLDVLSEDERQHAWDTVGSALAALGYGRDGSIEPITDAFTAPGAAPASERSESDRGWIQARPNPRPAEDGRRHRVRIRWSTVGGIPGFVGVRTVRDGERIIARGPKGSRKVGWIRSERSFVLTLYADEEGQDPIASIVLRRDDPGDLFAT